MINILAALVNDLVYDIDGYELATNSPNHEVTYCRYYDKLLPNSDLQQYLPALTIIFKVERNAILRLACILSDPINTSRKTFSILLADPNAIEITKQWVQECIAKLVEY